jgi:glycine betaine/choline ABC-type transport system substrate-binding protein
MSEIIEASRKDDYITNEFVTYRGSFSTKYGIELYPKSLGYGRAESKSAWITDVYSTECGIEFSKYQFKNLNDDEVQFFESLILLEESSYVVSFEAILKKVNSEYTLENRRNFKKEF